MEKGVRSWESTLAAFLNLKGFRRAFNQSHPDPAFGELLTKVIPVFVELSWSFQRKLSCFCRASNKIHSDPAFVELLIKVILLL